MQVLYVYISLICVFDAFADVDAVLALWCGNARAQNIPLPGLLIQAKARELATGLGQVDFQSSYS